MSAYGTIGVKGRTSELPLPIIRWTTRDKTVRSQTFIHTYHLTLEAALKSPGLVEYLHSVFARIVEDGKTYPMEVAEGERYSRQAFENYFFSADVIVGVLAEGSGDDSSIERQDGVEIVSGTSGDPFGSSGSTGDGQPSAWGDLIAGFYYVCLFHTSIFHSADGD